ncbi:hypothetical protein K505DRAFT_376359 [Melanomma pulvis-pyrius CBS 109.77]|uniref:Uncharacterized protein n=1 Tax=Melanomma pulvis-pyrius CBS 109.77 TaxID=1314802 RepID=A0A6A6X6N8_9PLEO|nr:hypothetical protein K505DRAFT_376359 [Melanomma pulvis-pyrius CBS 109.77]
MDPFTALSLAASIVQFVDFGTRTASKISELYHSASGLTQNQDEILESARRFEKLAEKLSRVSLPEENDASVIVDHASFHALLLSCKSRATDIIAMVEDLKVQKSRALWGSIRQGARGSRKRHEIEQLVAKMKELHDFLNTYLLALLCDHNSKVYRELLLVMNEQARMEVDWALDIKDIRDSLVGEIKAQRVAQKDSEPATMESMAQKLSTLASNGSTMSSGQGVLNNLTFPEMPMRHSNVAEAHRNTFDWILHQDGSDQKNSLAAWLENGDGIYWVAGKAGSGKSTLLKYLWKHPKTLELLRPWATPLELVVAKHFFWYSGNRLQKSQEGLIRSLLFEILRLCPHLIPMVFPSRKEQFVTAYWDRAELMDAFNCLIRQSIQKYRFCFFIDGLDEYDGDHFELVQLFKNLFNCPSIKICVSSRPLNVFQEVLGQQQHTCMYLEQFTRRDIESYVRDKMRNSARFSALEEEDPRSSELIEEIVEKAQGVFLWVILVVRSLIRGLTNADTFHDLQRRLREFPRELEPFLRHMFNTIDPFYQSETAKYCQIALHARSPYRLRTYSLIDEENLESALSVHLRSIEWGGPEALDKLRNTQKRINARCHGLLETYDSSQVVDFFHRTVRDFLSLDDMRASLHQKYPAGKDIHLLLCRTLLGELRCIPEIDHPTSVHSIKGSKSALKISNVRTTFDMKQCMDILRDFFYHVEQIELISDETPVLLIEELSEVLRVSLPALEFVHGFDNALDWKLDTEESFVRYSLDCGLVHYPAHKYMENPILMSDNPRKMLLIRLLSTPSTFVQKNYRTSDVIRTLLRQGTPANCTVLTEWGTEMLFSRSELTPEASCSNNSYFKKAQLETPWQIFLFYIYNRAHTASPSHLNMWFEVAKMLLEFGADTEEQVEVGRVNPLTLSDFFCVVFPPAEAQVLCEILREQSAKTKLEINDQLANTDCIGSERPVLKTSIFGWLTSWVPF